MDESTAGPSIDDIARACVMELMHSHEAREVIIARAIRKALEVHGHLVDAEREACAKIAEGWAGGQYVGLEAEFAGASIAAIIRDRK